MIVIVRFEIDDDRRRALRSRWVDKPGLATRKEIINEIKSTIEILFDDHLTDYEARHEQKDA